MKKYVVILLWLFALVSMGLQPVRAQGAAPVITAKTISREEAAKKYPPPNGKSYPFAERISSAEHGTPGFFKSPYSSRVYDCREIQPGQLVLDENTKKVFVRP
jgi:hypothetical protein